MSKPLPDAVKPFKTGKSDKSTFIAHANDWADAINALLDKAQNAEQNPTVILVTRNGDELWEATFSGDGIRFIRRIA